MGAYSSKDGGRSVKPLPIGWLGSIPRAPTKYVGVGESINTVRCERIIGGFDSLTSTQVSLHHPMMVIVS